MGNLECNICEYNTPSIIYSEGGYSYAICENCGHVFQTFRQDRVHYHKLPYESQWDNYLEHTKNRSQYISDFCKDFIDKFTHIFDVGCGPGGVIKGLQELHPNKTVSGLTSPSDKDKILDGLDVELGDFDEVEIEDNGKDFIICSHILEHFLNPKESIAKLANILQPTEGHIYIEVPSFYWAEIRSNPQYYPVHLSYFSKQQLKNLLHSSGFEVMKIHESKYWGNIKVVAKYTGITKPFRKEIWWVKFYKQVFLKNCIYPIINLIKKYKKIGPNE